MKPMTFRAIFMATAVVPALALPASAYTLSTGSGDGFLTVDVDLLGSFGSAIGGDGAGEAFYDPVGPVDEAGTVFESGVAISFANIRQFLSTGSLRDLLTSDPDQQMFISAPALDAAASIPGTRAVSTFQIPNLGVRLIQEVSVSVDGSGAQTGSALTQTYQLTNTGGVTTSFDLVRYVDGDLNFDGSISDGGGRLTLAGNEILFQTDADSDGSASTTFVGITATGGAVQAGNRFQISSFSALRGNVANGLPLADFIEGDDDGDGFVDAPYDVTMALRNAFSVAPGQTVSYTTQTLFGNAVPPSPGSSETLPLLPTERIDDAFVFDLDTVPAGETVWFDPIVTTGFDYLAEGNAFNQITAPSLGVVGDADGYLISFDGTTVALAPGGTLIFDAPVSAFTLSGIDPTLLLDPDDPLAFPIGIILADVGGRLFITPLTENFEPGGPGAAIPLPAAGWLLGAAVLGVGALRRRRARG